MVCGGTWKQASRTKSTRIITAGNLESDLLGHQTTRRLFAPDLGCSTTAKTLPFSSLQGIRRPSLDTCASRWSPGCPGPPSEPFQMVRTGAKNGGWQLNGVPGFPAIPADATAGLATSILEGAAYPAAFLSGPCPPACGVGAGGMDRH